MYFTVQQAVRMYNRMMRPVFDDYEVSFVADTAYDGGEFSGPILSDMLEQKEDHIFSVITDRTGITRARMVEEMYRQEQEHYLLAERGPMYH